MSIFYFCSVYELLSKAKLFLLDAVLRPFLSECFPGQIELTLYNPRASLTGKLVVCGQSFCKDFYKRSGLGCSGNSSCMYDQAYGDGSSTRGYFVEDVVQYNKVSGDLQTKSGNGSVIFG